MISSPDMPLFAHVVKEPHDWVKSTLVVPPPINTDINPAELCLQPGKSALKSGSNSPAHSEASSTSPSPEPQRSISFSNKLEDVRYFKEKDKTSKVSRTRSKGELMSKTPPWLVMAAQTLQAHADSNGSSDKDIATETSWQEAEHETTHSSTDRDKNVDEQEYEDADELNEEHKEEHKNVVENEEVHQDEHNKERDVERDEQLNGDYDHDHDHEHEHEHKYGQEGDFEHEQTHTNEQIHEHDEGQQVQATGQPNNVSDNMQRHKIVVNLSETTVMSPTPSVPAANVLAHLLTDSNSVRSEETTSTRGLSSRDMSLSSVQSEDVVVEIVQSCDEHEIIDGDKASDTLEYSTFEEDDGAVYEAELVTATFINGEREVSNDEHVPRKAEVLDLGFKEEESGETAMHLAELQAEEQRVVLLDAQLHEWEETKLQEEDLENSTLELEKRKNEDAMHLAELQAEEQRVELLAAQLRAGEEARLLVELQEEEDARELENFTLELEKRKNEDAMHVAELQAEEQRVELLAAQLRAGEEARLLVELQEEEDARELENSTLELEKRKNEDAMHVAELQAEEQRVELLAAQLRAGEEARLLVELQEEEDAREQEMLNIAYADDIGVADNVHFDGEYVNKDQEGSVVLQGDFTKARHPNCIVDDEDTSHKQTLTAPVFVSDYLYDDDPDYPSTREEKRIVAIGVEFSSELQTMIQQYDKSSAHRNTTSESSSSGISGNSPPPLDLSPSEQGDWEFLNRSVRTADALEDSLPMKEYESKLVDLRAVSLAGAVCRAVGSKSVRLKAKSFYYWKYEHVGGVEAVGPVFKYIEASTSTTSDQSRPVMFTPGRPLRASYGSDTLGSTSRLDAGMRFAIKVLDKHSRRMKILSRFDCLQRTWQILKSNNLSESHTLDFSDIVEEAYAEEVLHTEASPLGAAATSSGEYMSPSSEHKRFHAMTKALSEAEVDAEEEGCSEDLLLLGAMPAVLTCVFKANEVSYNCVHFVHCTHS
jgi:hypothetical protein